MRFGGRWLVEGFRRHLCPHPTPSWGQAPALHFSVSALGGSLPCSCQSFMPAAAGTPGYENWAYWLVEGSVVVCARHPTPSWGQAPALHFSVSALDGSPFTLTSILSHRGRGRRPGAVGLPNSLPSSSDAWTITLDELCIPLRKCYLCPLSPVVQALRPWIPALAGIKSAGAEVPGFSRG